MHPLLARPRALSMYLLFWAGLSAVPWVLVHSAAGAIAFIVSVVGAVSFGLGTLPVWYLCLTLPLKPTRLGRVAAIHAAAAACWSVLFLACWQLLAELAAFLSSARSLPADVSAAHGALLAVGALFYLLVAAFHYVLAEQEQRHAAGKRQAELALATQRAELSALRAQVHPHFLFNSLNTVSALIGYDTEKAREACLLLADYLRTALRAQERPQVRLEEEWSLCERYLAVEALRLGERLRLEVTMQQPALACEIPALLLQPLVENAVTHGIAPVDEPRPLRARAALRDARLLIELENGLDPAPRPRAGGLGLTNVRARLHAQYGRDATLRVEREADVFRVVLDLPATPVSPAEPHD